MDLGGTPDHYSAGRSDDSVSVQGAFREEDPKGSTLHGLLIDR